MSQPISDIITQTITRTAQSVTRSNFGTILLIMEADSASPPFANRTKEYSGSTILTDMIADGITSGTYAYDSAAKIRAQNPNVSKIKVGIKYTGSGADASWTAALTAIRAYDTDWYGFTIVSTTLADQKEVADWAQTVTDPKVLFAIRSADTDIINTADESSGYAEISNTGSLGAFTGATVPAIATQSDYELDVTVDGTAYQLATISINVADDWDDICTAIETSLQAATSSTETCAIVAGKIRITSATTGDSSAIVIAAGTAGTGSGDLLAVIDALGATYTTNLDTPVDGEEDIADYLADNNYNRSFCFYHASAATNYIDAAAMGERFPKDPAVGTWMFKTLTGIESYSLTSTQRSNAIAKYCNIYITRGGIDMTEEGTVGNGRFIDEERGIDQLEAYVAEDTFELLVQAEKVSFNDDGITQVQGKIEGALKKAETNIINTGSVVTVPLREDTLTADRQARELKGVTYTATLQGAIHKIDISGTVTI